MINNSNNQQILKLISTNTSEINEVERMKILFKKIIPFLKDCIKKKKFEVFITADSYAYVNYLRLSHDGKNY